MAFYYDSFSYDPMQGMPTATWSITSKGIGLKEQKAQRIINASGSYVATWNTALEEIDHGCEAKIYLSDQGYDAGIIARSDLAGDECYVLLVTSDGSGDKDESTLHRRTSGGNGPAIETFAFDTTIGSTDNVYLRLEVETLGNGNVLLSAWHGSNKADGWEYDGTYTDSAGGKHTTGNYTGIISTGTKGAGKTDEISWDDFLAYDPFDTLWIDADRGRAGGIGTFFQPMDNIAGSLLSARTSCMNGETTIKVLSDLAESIDITHERHGGTSWWGEGNMGLKLTAFNDRRVWSDSTGTDNIAVTGDADFIYFQGFDFEIGTNVADDHIIVEAADLNTQFNGCSFELTKDAHGQTKNYGVSAGGDTGSVTFNYCYFFAHPSWSAYGDVAIYNPIANGETMSYIYIDRCIFYGSIKNGIYSNGAGTLNGTNILHCSFMDMGDNGEVTSGVRFECTGGDGANGHSVRDSLFASEDFETDDLDTGINVGADRELISARNAFFTVDTERGGDGDITSTDDFDSTDPDSKSLAAYRWKESAIADEKVPGILLAKDWSPTNINIRYAALDGTAIGALRGLGAQRLPLLPAGQYRLMDAGIVSTTNSWLSPTTITDATNINIRSAENKEAIMTFSVPAQNYVFDGVSYGELKHGRYINLKVGYSADNLTQGRYLIDEVKVQRTHNQNTLIVKCVDATKMLTDTVDLGYPDPNMYLLTYDPARRDAKGPDLVYMPDTFDGWTVAEAARALLAKCRIPSTQTWGTYSPDRSGYTIEDIADTIRLQKSRGYYVAFPIKQRQEAFLENKGGEEWVGVPLWNRLQKLVSKFGLDFHFNYEGSAVLAGASNPIRIHHRHDSLTTIANGLSTDPTYVANPRAFGGGYIDLTSSQTLLINNTDHGFVGIELYFERNNGAGTITVAVDGVNVPAYTAYPLDRDAGDYWFTDNADVDGSHECILKIATGLDFSMHDVSIDVGSANVRFSGYGIYVRRERSNTEHEFPIGTLTRINADYDIDTLVNDVVVTGDNREVENNLMVHGRSVDLASQDTPSAANYIGTAKQAWLHLEDVPNHDHAQFIADAIIHRHRQIRGTLKFETYAHPHLEVGDGIKAFEHQTSPSGVYWLTSNSTTFTRQDTGVKLHQAFEATPYEPFPSYEPPIDNPSIPASGAITDAIVTLSNGALIATAGYNPYDAYPTALKDKVVVNIQWKLWKEGLVTIRVRDEQTNQVQEVVENGTLMTPGDYTTATNNHRQWTGKWWDNSGVPSEGGRWVAAPNYPGKREEHEAGDHVNPGTLYATKGLSYVEIELKEKSTFRPLAKVIAELDEVGGAWQTRTKSFVIDLDMGPPGPGPSNGRVSFHIEHFPRYDYTGNHDGWWWRSISGHGFRYDIYSDDYVDRDGNELGMRIVCNVGQRESRIYFAGVIEAWSLLRAWSATYSRHVVQANKTDFHWLPEHTDGTGALRLEVENSEDGIITIPVSNPTHWLLPEGGTSPSNGYVFYFNPNSIGAEIAGTTEQRGLNYLYSDSVPEAIAGSDYAEPGHAYYNWSHSNVTKGYAWIVGFNQLLPKITNSLYLEDRSGRLYKGLMTHSIVDRDNRYWDSRRYDQRSGETLLHTALHKGYYNLGESIRTHHNTSHDWIHFTIDPTSTEVSMAYGEGY